MNEQNLLDLMKEAGAAKVEAPAFFETQILARLEERQKQRSAVRLWQSFSLGFASVAAAVAIFFSIHNVGDESNAFQAGLSRPYAVRVELTEYTGAAVAEAEIVLPEGVYFYSKNLPELTERRSLRLAWDEGARPDVLPFVVHGANEGLKTVTVRFFDAQNNVVGEKQIEIRFVRDERIKG